MIRLKSLIKEITDADLNRILQKIRTKQFKLFGQGDNGRVYEISGEDKLFKITTEQEEYRVAERILDNYSNFTTFIPVYYVDGKNMYIMAKATDISQQQKNAINQFIDDYKNYAREQGGEVSIFDFTKVTDNIDPILDNFLNSLESDVNKLNIPEFDLDLDFKSDNIMIWNGNMVMIDW
jgi:hypothetical protein